MKISLKEIIKLFLVSLILILSSIAQAEQVNDLSGVAGNIMDSVVFMSDFVQTACFVIGSAFLFTSLIKYIEHRRSPLMVPISTVIFLLVAGIILILLPFLSYFVNNGVSYSLLKS